MRKFNLVSETTIERTFSTLLNENKIEKISGGRFTEYKWVVNKLDYLAMYDEMI